MVDAKHHGIPRLDIRPPVTKLAQLLGADAGIVRGIKDQHDVLSAKAVMRQSLFDKQEDSAEARVTRAIDAAQQRWASAMRMTLYAAGAALVLAAAALGMVIFR